MIDKTTLVRDFVRDHSCLVEDLRVAANLLPRQEVALIHSLRRYADELAEYDHFNPFKKN